MPIIRSLRLYRYSQHVAHNFGYSLVVGVAYGCKLCVRVEGCCSTEPDQSTLRPSILTFKINFNITLPSEPRHSQCLLSSLKQKMHINGLHSDGLSLDTLRGWSNAILPNFWLGSTLKSLARCDEINSVTRVGTLIVATIYLQLIQNRYMFRSFTVLQCSHQHCVQPAASDVEVVGYL